MLADGVALRCMPWIILPGRITPNPRQSVITYGEERDHPSTPYADLRTDGRPPSEDVPGRRRDDSFVNPPAQTSTYVTTPTRGALFDA
jgi:hypothetical protein